MASDTASRQQRLYFLDNLRSITIICVVFFHASLAYTNYVPSWWWVIDVQKSYVFDIFVLSTEIFRMPLLFLIAGYFATRTLARKSKSEYIKEKLVRIVAPWILGVLFLAPLIQYFYYLSRETNPPNYIFYWLNIFFGSAYTQAHYWFLGILALLSLVLALVYHFFPSIIKTYSQPSAPSFKFLILFGLLQSIAFFCVNLFANDYVSYTLIKYIIEVRVTRFVLFASYFFLGVYAYKQQWFTASGYTPKPKLWLWSSAISFVAYMGFKFTFFSNMDSLPVLAVNAILLCSFCLCTVFAMFAVFYRWANFASTIMGKLSANSYALYYIHLPIVLYCNLLVQGYTWNVYVKYFVVVSVSLITSYIICKYILAKTIFFGKARKEAVAKPDVMITNKLAESRVQQ